jgi:hypothetical protein
VKLALVKVLVQVVPPSVDLKMRLERGPLVPPPPSFMPAMYTVPSKSPVIWTSRIKGLPLVNWCCVQVEPLLVETLTKRAPPPTPKSFRETYMFPKWGEDVLLSAQPDSRSSAKPL